MCSSKPNELVKNATKFETLVCYYIHSSPFFLDPLGVRAQIIRCGGDHRNERLAKVNFTLVFLLSCYMRWRYQYTNVPREVTTFLLCPKSKFQLKEKRGICFWYIHVHHHSAVIIPKNSGKISKFQKKTFSTQKRPKPKTIYIHRKIHLGLTIFCNEKTTKREWSRGGVF